ncbi:type II toxin-antitoxin system RelB/DinJ family antitoxin [uncultured Fibrobacter sp.]|uniref:type II toxin-antitoxin system RelB/DinJ family antitoxin n=1 Tax=uncultured Fibrobacter sp. TaxID=261512 RepID=UPI0025E832E3|nr:type II toxin-antitoxin system RelB/DinJ family antitoxin [uncultured Fibrobacter sp.]
MATTVLQVRMDEDLKNEASELFEKLGLDIPTAIRIFFKRAVTEKGIPFELREPTAVYDAGSGASSIDRRAAALENLQKYRGRIPAGMDYKKELAEARMEKIQEIFADDKGWANEQEMISDLAKFRRSRMKG